MVWILTARISCVLERSRVDFMARQFSCYIFPDNFFEYLPYHYPNIILSTFKPEHVLSIHTFTPVPNHRSFYAVFKTTNPMILRWHMHAAKVTSEHLNPGENGFLLCVICLTELRTSGQAQRITFREELKIYYCQLNREADHDENWDDTIYQLL